MDDCFRFQDVRIRFSIKGEGPTAVLLHGYTESRQIWFDFAEKLSREYTVVMPDLPGHGESSLTPDLSMDSMADMVYELISHLEIPDIILIGHSMGGYVSCRFAEKYPSKVKGLGLFHSSARADTPEIRENRMRTIEIIEQNHSEFLTQFIPSLFYEGNRGNLEEEILFLQNSAAQMSAETLIAAQKAMADRQGSLELLTSASYPMLFIIGKQDSRVDFSKVFAQAALPEKSFVLLLDNCGHMGYLEKPDETFAALKGFLQACTA
jgi:pimeloyl-ACP methyl ester carboxylesterase